tara:strand:- start:257 stop:679 length:423 start_codon:yes stop_codon:yes gene_type:complete
LKKKISSKDKKDWLKFLESKEKVYDKESNFTKSYNKTKKQTIDLHGYSLKDANLKIKNFINNSYEKNIKEITIITGKGTRSKVEDNPYLSKDLSILKHSVPSFITSQLDLMSKIKNINLKDIEDSSKGSFTIYLKNKTTE